MLELLATFFVISLTGALSPGPLTTMAIAEGSRRGKWSGWWLAVGHGIVEGVYVAFIAVILWLGRDTVLRQPIITVLIAMIGGVFLVWMGCRMAWDAWQHRLTLTYESNQEAYNGLVSTGIIFSVSNPYWWIWWALIASAFVSQSLTWGMGGVFLLFFFHWLTDLGWLTGLSWLTGSGRNLIKPQLYRWILIACGAILSVFGFVFIGVGIQIFLTGEVM